MKDRVFNIDFPVFANYQIKVIICDSLKASFKKYPKCQDIKEVEDDTDAAYTIHVVDEARGMIFLKRKGHIGTVAHESWHAINRMFEYVGADLESEAVAYHLGYMVNQIVGRSGINWRALL